MERNENLTLGIDFGSESVGISIIDTENHTILPSVSIWKANTSKERNRIRRTRRNILHTKERNTRLLRVLNMCRCLPSDFTSHFNWAQTDEDRGIGTLKKSESKYTDYPNLIESDVYRDSLMHMRQWFYVNRPNAKPANGWLPIWLSVYGQFHELTDHELALTLIYMSKRRGADYMLSNDDSELVAQIKSNNERISQSHTTCFELELNRLNNIDKVHLGTISREFYVSAIDSLLKEQEKYKPWLTSREKLEEVVSNLYRSNKVHREKRLNKNMTLREFIINDVIMYQRRGNQKSKIKKCPYEKKILSNGKVHSERAICKSHPLYRQFVAWQTVNNLEFTDKKSREKLDFDRDIAYDYLFRTEKPSILELTKLLNLSNCYSNYSSKDAKLPENKSVGHMITVLQNAGMSEEKSTDYKTLEQLWNIIYSAEDTDELKKGIQRFSKKNNLNWSVFKEEVRTLQITSVGYGQISKKALQKIMPYIKDGNSYQASLLAVYDNIKSIPVYNLDELKDVFEEWCKNGSILPTIITEARRSFSRIIETIESTGYFPGHIVIEGSKDVPMTKEEIESHNTRLRIQTREKRLKKTFITILNKKQSVKNMVKVSVYFEYCYNNDKDVKSQIDAIYKIKDEDISKYEKEVRKLIKVIDGKYKCPYTSREISLAELFTEDVEVEHILARSKTFENTIENYALTFSTINLLKSDLAPAVFINRYGGTNDIKTWKDYEKDVKNYYKNIKSKKERLLAADFTTGFKKFQLQKTMLLESIFQNLFCSLFPDITEPKQERVICVPPQTVRFIKMTLTKLNRKFLDEFVKPRLRCLDRFNESQPVESKDYKTPRYIRKTEEGDAIENIDNPKRMDNRHHALDAICCALITPKFRRNLDESIKHGFELKESGLVSLLNTWEGFEDDIINSLKDIEVKFHVKRRRSRTTCGVYKSYDDNGEIVYKKTKRTRSVSRQIHKETFLGYKNGVYSVRKKISNIDFSKIDSLLLKYKKQGLLTDDQRMKIKNALIDYFSSNYKMNADTLNILVRWAYLNIGRSDTDLKWIYSEEGLAEMNANMDSLCTYLGYKSSHVHIDSLKAISSGDKKFSIDKEGVSGKYVVAEKGMNDYAVVLKNPDTGRNVLFIGDGDKNLFEQDKYNCCIKDGYEIVTEANVGDCIEIEGKLWRIISFDTQAGIYCIPNNWGEVKDNELQFHKKKTYSISGTTILQLINRNSVITRFKLKSYIE